MAARPAFELADVFRRHGETYAQLNAGHLGRVERRVTAAIAASPPSHLSFGLPPHSSPPPATTALPLPPPPLPHPPLSPTPTLPLPFSPPLLPPLRSFGELQRIGIESSGSYGAGLLRFMQQAGIAVLEVTTPDKQDRRRRGKNDDLDAQNAAHAAFAGQRTVTPRSRDGMIESLRVLMACRKTAVSARRVALQMIHNTIVCAPDGLRDQLRSLTRMQLVRTLAAWRPDLTAYRDLDSAYRIGLKSLARRYLELHDEIADLDVMIAAIVDELAPNLVARNSIGHIGAAQLLLTAGDNPERLRSEASFASLCGVSPVPASSGKTVRHRLNRGGDRAANSALHIIAIGRLRTDQRTKDYVARRTAEGHSKLDAIRTLKRYLAREVFTLITQRRKEINAIRIAA